MPRDPRAFIWEARQAVAHLRSFIEGKAWNYYQEDVGLGGSPGVAGDGAEGGLSSVSECRGVAEMLGGFGLS